jgi:hypothetical protein
VAGFKEKQSWEDAAKNQKEARSHRSERGPSSRYCLFESPEMKRKLKKEREEKMLALGLMEWERPDKQRQVIPLTDCAQLPNGHILPKIEFLMDHLGAREVTQRLLKLGITYRDSSSLIKYREKLDEWIREVATVREG